MSRPEAEQLDYGELKTAVAAWIKRADLTSVIPTFIALAESDITNDVRCRAMELRAGITLAGETQPHPDGLIEVRQLVIGGEEYEYVTPQVYEANTDARRRIFTSVGQSFLINGGASGDVGTLVYRAGFAALAQDADTNWLLTNHPEVYLWAALRHACIYTLDDAGRASYAQLYAGAVERLNRREAMNSHSGPMRLRAENME